MKHSNNDSPDYPRHLQRYRRGLALAVALTLIPTALVYWRPFGSSAMGLWVLALTMLQVAIHFRFFLGIGQGQREKTAALALTALIIVLMTAGTLLVYFDQAARM